MDDIEILNEDELIQQNTGNVNTQQGNVQNNNDGVNNDNDVPLDIIYSVAIGGRITRTNPTCNLSYIHKESIIVSKIKRFKCVYSDIEEINNNYEKVSEMKLYKTLDTSTSLLNNTNGFISIVNSFSLPINEITTTLSYSDDSISSHIAHPTVEKAKDFIKIIRKCTTNGHTINNQSISVLNKDDYKKLYEFIEEFMYGKCNIYENMNISDVNINPLRQYIRVNYRYINLYRSRFGYVTNNSPQFDNNRCKDVILTFHTGRNYGNTNTNYMFFPELKAEFNYFSILNCIENKNNEDKFKFDINYGTFNGSNGVYDYNIKIYIKKELNNDILNGKTNINKNMFEILFKKANLQKALAILNDEHLKLLYDNNIGNKKVEENIDDFDTDIKSLESKLEVVLYNYQRNNVKWMRKKEIESEDDQKDYYIEDGNFKTFKFNDKKYMVKNIKSDKSIENKITPYNVENSSKFMKECKLYGGILADDVGLGKTLSSISYILYDKFRKDNTLYKNIKLNKNKNNINLIIVPARLIVQWYLEVKKYTKSDVYKNLKICKLATMNDIKKNNNEEFYENDIVIVSKNLFMNQNYKNYINPPKTKKTNDKPPAKPPSPVKNTTEKIVTAVSGLLGANKNLDDLNTTEKKDVEKKTKKKKEDPDAGKEPLDLFKINFRRILMDEAHEYLVDNIIYDPEYCENFNEYKAIIGNDGSCKYDCSKKIKRYKDSTISCQGVDKKDRLLTDDLVKLKSKYRWIITATPLKYSNPSINNILKFLTKNNKDIITGGVKIIKKLFVNNVRYNNKNNINNEISIPIFNEEIQYLNQTNVERRIYLHNQHNLNLLFQLCTHVSAVNDPGEDKTEEGNILTLDGINKIMKQKFTKSLALEKDTKKNRNEELGHMIDNKARYDTINEIIKNYYDFTTIDNLSDLKENFGTWLKNNRDIRDQIVSEIEVYVNSSDGTNMNQTLNSVISDTSLEYQTSSTIEKVYLFKILFDYKTNKINNRIKTLKESIEKIEGNIGKINNQIKSFSGKEFIKESLQDPCGICYDDFSETFIMTKCRHILCDGCFDAIKGTKNEIPCPFCRTPIRNNDYNIVKVSVTEETETNEEIKEQTDEEKVEEEMINKYGTKFNYLIKYLNKLFKDPNNRVIIFSQYDRMLKMIGSVLNDFKIKHLFMKGNVHVVSKNINKFKTDPSYKIIMLSSETSASGNNLTEANHIIFVDVINADQNKTQSIETQAIGRAVRLGQLKPVTIKRLIMKNTVEEEYYTKNKYDIKSLVM